MLKRKVYNQLLEWKNSRDKKCLMIKGARQVGKTYIVREFGLKEYESFVEINFIKNPALKEIFAGDLNAETIYKKMTINIKNINLVPGKTLLFLDEIQACGRARTAIKFLTEDGRYDVITSGSLLGLTYSEDADENVEEPDSVPTGYEDFITMYSLDFEEFLWANGYTQDQIEALRDLYVKNEKISDITYNTYEELFREYIVVGGMPEVVSNFVENHDFNKVNKLQQQIIANYEFDISKHAKGAEKAKIKRCYDSIPKQLAKELKKFQYSIVESGQTSKKYGSSITWLVDSALVHQCCCIREPYIPLLGNADDGQFKLYINDTGLLCSMYGFDTKQAILNNTIKGNVKGGIYENVIAECLVKLGYKLYYYRPDDQHEIEFLIEKDGEVIPIEVKAGNNPTPSLNQYIAKYKPTKAFKLIGGQIGLVGAKLTIPHFMVMFL